MIDFMFFVKTLALTILLVIAMQIQVGSRTVETHAMSFVQGSTVAQPLNSVARGAGKLFHDITQKIWNGVHKNQKKSKKEETRNGASSFSKAT